jgi:O-succinylbenzoate synthase
VSELSQLGPVRFDSAEAVRVSIPMHEPFRISSGEVSNKEAILLRISDDIAFGWGESSSMPGAFYSNDTPDSCEKQLVKAIPDLIGREFPTMLAFETELRSRALSPFVRVAFECAAWELLARKQSVSLRELFGLPEQDVDTGLAIGLYDSTTELQQALERYRPRDYSRLKIKIKRGHDLALVKAVRKWYGDIPLFVDANADYKESEIAIFQQLDDFGLMMFEQPFAKADVETSRKLQQSIKTPICWDEGVEDASDVFQAAEFDAARIVNIKLQRVGGYLEAFRIINACVQKDIPFWMGTMPELGIGSAQALVLASHPACRFPTDVEPSERWYIDDILNPALRMNSKKLSLPSGAGLGFEIDREAIRRFEIKSWNFPQ